MQVRQEDGPLNGLWEFPGGKIEAGENPEQAARREFREEVGEYIRPSDTVTIFKIHPYEYKDRNISLHVHLSFIDQLPENKGKWFALDYESFSTGLAGQIPEVNHMIIDQVLSYFKREWTYFTEQTCQQA